MDEAPPKRNLSPEIALAVLGIILSVGLLKANELLDFLNRVELYYVYTDAKTIKVFVIEILAMALFFTCYLSFLIITILGTLRIVVSAGDRHQFNAGEDRLTLGGWLALSILALAAVHFFSLALASCHMMHRYEVITDMSREPGYSVEWVMSPSQRGNGRITKVTYFSEADKKTAP